MLKSVHPPGQHALVLIFLLLGCQSRGFESQSETNIKSDTSENQLKQAKEVQSQVFQTLLAQAFQQNCRIGQNETLCYIDTSSDTPVLKTLKTPKMEDIEEAFLANRAVFEGDQDAQAKLGDTFKSYLAGAKDCKLEFKEEEEVSKPVRMLESSDVSSCLEREGIFYRGPEAPYGVRNYYCGLPGKFPNIRQCFTYSIRPKRNWSGDTTHKGTSYRMSWNLNFKQTIPALALVQLEALIQASQFRLSGLNQELESIKSMQDQDSKSKRKILEKERTKTSDKITLLTNDLQTLEGNLKNLSPTELKDVLQKSITPFYNRDADDWSVAYESNRGKMKFKRLIRYAYTPGSSSAWDPASPDDIKVRIDWSPLTASGQRDDDNDDDAQEVNGDTFAKSGTSDAKTVFEPLPDVIKSYEYCLNNGEPSIVGVRKEGTKVDEEIRTSRNGVYFSEDTLPSEVYHRAWSDQPKAGQGPMCYIEKTQENVFKTLWFTALNETFVVAPLNSERRPLNQDETLNDINSYAYLPVSFEMLYPERAHKCGTGDDITFGPECSD